MPHHTRSTDMKREPTTRSSDTPPAPTDWLDERKASAKDADTEELPSRRRRDRGNSRGVGQAVESRRGSHR